jgi:5-methylcytosine-specific restriction endonuclease McrA
VDVLVLSSTYEPINRVSWQRAFVLIANGLVEVLDEYSDWVIRSAKQAFNVPAVIRFLKGKVGWRRGVRFSRENVYARDKGQCAYCGTKVSKSEYTYDHVTPKSRGGKTRWENIVVCCLDCNQNKGNRTPEQAGMKLRVKPEKPKSLPGGNKLLLPNKIPEQWKAYLRDFMYWHGELNADV